MLRRLIFLDTGVLIAASRGTGDAAKKAFEVINDPDVDFASSIFVQLETLPQPRYNKKSEEVEFYEAFYQEVSVWAEPTEALAQYALAEASKNGLGAVDALHVAAAVRCGADEFITTEKPNAPLHRVSSIPVRTIAS